MADKKYFPKSGVPVRKTEELLPATFKTPSNKKFMQGVVDPLLQPGVLDKTVGYIGRRHGKTFNGTDTYLDTDNSLRSVYQLDPGVVFNDANGNITDFYDYLDFKNILPFFHNGVERDDKLTEQDHYTWDPPIDWDKFVNFREYYWVPAGPPSIEVAGQFDNIESTYSVALGTESSFIFTPDSYTNNPTITLYRGQTYKFKVNCPDQGFVIRTNYDTGSLTYDSNFPYSRNDQVVQGDVLYQANKDVLANPGHIITEDDPDWDEVALVSSANALDYNNGVTNNGIEFGTVEFEVPYNAPDTLFYQSISDPNRVGRFIIDSVISNTVINVEQEVIGKSTYVSSNDVQFSNGLVVTFTGKVSPEKYATGDWLVQGVGSAITLTRFDTLLPPPIISGEESDVLFDDEPFDSQPFADAKYVPLEKDYITIARDSFDANAWSRYNRWFHRSVLEYAYGVRGQSYPAPEDARAKRPIIEFSANIQLFNHGAQSKDLVDYIDTFTEDVFSTIEGAEDYYVDGELLFDGARLLVTADTDSLANNRIYVVKKITHLGKDQITLVEAEDCDPNLGECVIVRRGTKNEGKIFHYTGTIWTASQEKTAVNQAPLFDAFDDNGVSFSDDDTYPVSTFTGTPLIAYAVGNGVDDTELGFPLSYLSISNVGDTLFNWVWDSETFMYSVNNSSQTKNVATGFYKKNPTETYLNGWTLFNNKYAQPIVDTVTLNADEPTNTLNFKTVIWDDLDWDNAIIVFYLNGKKLSASYEFIAGSFVFDQEFVQDDVVTIKLIADIIPDQGYYEFPVGLEKNPLNKEVTEFTYGQAIDHLQSALEFDDRVTGTLPGNTNLRDLGQFQNAAKRFLKHSGSAPLALSLLADKQANIIKATQFAKKAYSEFKHNFLERATKISYNENTVDFVDDIITAMTNTKTANSPWSDSDMIGNGAFTALNYTVKDDGITTFALSSKFSLDTISRSAVYVYINGKQLLHSRDYEFNDTFGFVNITKDIVEGDEIEIREYVSTAINHIPPTPTSLGMYKKYTPKTFTDHTYHTPTPVIQGHDGSITVAYGDYRDDLLLELEYRIYNNIKQEYDETLFDIDSVVGGYYGNAEYTKAELDAIVSPEYLKWIHTTNYDYVNNTYFRETEPFTYTYSNMTDPTMTQQLPGYWRGVYKWVYDTDRPDSRPWEMLGFSQKPDWFDSEYGTAPYTSNNLILWEDLEAGIIRHGDRAGTYDRYKRPGMSKYIPVDDNGVSLDPLTSGFAKNFTLVNNRGSFVPGDVAPAEYAWRAGSEWPFAIMIAMCLLKPFEFITTNFDRSKSKVNKIGQTVNSVTDMFITPDDIIVPTLDGEQSEGLVQYVTGYIKAKGSTEDELRDKLASIDVALSTRMSGFIDKAEQNYILDSKNPGATNSSVFVPQENFDVIFNVSSPIKTIAYSGVILEKTESGWTITGYDTTAPYFNYYAPVTIDKDPIINVGGVSSPFVNWEEEKSFTNGQLCKNNEVFYRCIESHTSGLTFETKYWQKLPKLPVVGGVTAIRRSTFNTFKVKKALYGTVLTTVQEVVDLLLGYQKYLQAQGFVFDRFDHENQVAQDWVTSCKEFMFWTQHNWAAGSLITLSPGALKLTINQGVGVADNILDGFYEYQIFQSNGTPLPVENIDVARDFRKTTVEAVNTEDGIYLLKLFYVLKEHVTIFNDRTVFNDLIYDETTGYRQERLKSRGYRTTDWDGDYTSPGFIFDNVSVATWEPFKDYRLGDIVSYKSHYWTSQTNQFSKEEFDYNAWERTDSELKTQLVANFDYKVKQIEDYYNVTSEGIGRQPRELARHTIGYQQRQYLQDLAEDPTTQFLIYQGFIRDKGTNNAIVKVFDKLSKEVESTVELNEEWAFRVGQIGGTSQLTELEFGITKDDFKLNPQPISILETFEPGEIYHQYYIVETDDISINSDSRKENFFPTKYENEPKRSAGYVNPQHIDYTVKTRDGLYELDVEALLDNQYIWVTFDNANPANPWSVLRFAYVNLDLISADVNGEEILFHTFQDHPYAQGDLITIKGIAGVTGIYEVDRVADKTITIVVPGFTESALEYNTTDVFVGKFYESRVYNIDNYPVRDAAMLPMGGKLWIDENNEGLWEVIEKQQVYTSQKITSFGTADAENAGRAVLYNKFANHTIVTLPYPGTTATYLQTEDGLVVKQALPNPLGFELVLAGHHGDTLAMSPDGKWLAVGSPDVSFAANHYLGVFDNLVSNGVTEILTGQHVLHNGTLYEAIRNWDLLTETPDPATWPEATINKATVTYSDDIQGSIGGFAKQGVILLYKYEHNQWNLYDMVVSPVPVEDARFGHSISLSFNAAAEYYMAVSAPGEDKVYEFVNAGDEWSGSATDYAVDYAATPGEQFGYSVTVGASGNTLAVSSPSAVQDSTVVGKVEIFNEGTNVQTIIPPAIEANTKFGFCTKFNADASVLVITAPHTDTATYDTGLAYVYKLVNEQYVLSQELTNYSEFQSELFGVSVDICDDHIVIGAKNTPYAEPTTFDSNTTTFDQGLTAFPNQLGFLGAVYVFDLESDEYFLTEKLDSGDFVQNESFGVSVSCEDGVIVAGSDYYTLTNAFGDEVISGMARMFRRDANASSWNTVELQAPVSDIAKVKSIQLYDVDNSLVIDELDYVDHAKMKILNQADQELSFKTVYDPAVYSAGTDAQVVNEQQSWAEKNVGKLWWDLSTVKWLSYEQSDFAYKTANWNAQAPFSSIDVYEWVETTLLPSQWTEQADTNTGLAAGVSGTPKYDDTVYSKKVKYNEVSGKVQETLYYYWVKNTVVVPDKVVGRRLSASDVAAMIDNPIGTGLPYAGIVESNKVLVFNVEQYLGTDNISINIECIKDTRVKLNQIHNEYILLTEGDKDSVPNAKLEEKWIDSLVGTNAAGARVPDVNLPDKLKNGLSFRPAQSMFVDRFPILETSIDHVNSILDIEPFADTINFEHLNLFDEEPPETLNLYDFAVNTKLDLDQVGTVRLRTAKLYVNIVNGEIDTIEIIDKGFGYRTAPTITITGDGIDAEATSTIDRVGQLDTVTITNRGKRYSGATATVRNFSVLVHTDETINNFWCIYSWDDQANEFYRGQTQGYDTRRYWDYKDWWKEGFGIKSRIVVELQSIVGVPAIDVAVDDLIRIKEFSSGGWAVFRKVTETVEEDFSTEYEIVGRENGTIEFLSSLFDHQIGYDYNNPYDIENYDYSRAAELRNIFAAVKNDIFIGDYEVEWNELFFKSVHYAFVEQPYVDWAFKTSFLRATHNIGNMDQPISYKLENLESFNSYINEVKPYRTTIREYVEAHIAMDTAATSTTDFDLPAVYSSEAGKIVPVTEDDAIVNEYPWKWWADNKGYSIESIEVSSGGQDYLQPPSVLIEGDGEGATAQAYIANGQVSYIEVIDPGKNYINTPTVKLVGGNLPGSPEAVVAPIMGASKVRTLEVGMKFDRITKEGFVASAEQTDTFIGTGNTATFDLRYVPSYDKNKMSITVNGQIVFLSEYVISLYAVQTENNSTLYGRIVFNFVPTVGSEIVVTYEKNDSYLDAVNMINKYYSPTAGMKGNVTTQLMTGIDFGGTMIQGTTFDVTGGWDALPWYTDTWDSVTSSNDYYVRVNEYIESIALPTVPDYDVQITIYQVKNPYAKLVIDFGTADFANGGSLRVTGEGEFGVYGCDINIPAVTNVDLTPAEKTAEAKAFLLGELVKVPCISLAQFGDIETNELTILGAFTGSDKVITLSNMVIDTQSFADVTGRGSDNTTPIRIDDEFFASDPTDVKNPNAVMPTWFGDGSSNVIDFEEWYTDDFTVDLGDTLVFRTEFSDGTVSITDTNILDTDVQGGDMSSNSDDVPTAPNTIFGSYSTATGLTAEEIAILGGKFVQPAHVPAPEENVPGQVLDNLSIRVFNSVFGGAAPLQIKTKVGDDTTTVYDIGLNVAESASVTVYVDKIKRELGAGSDNYSIDVGDETVTFVTPPAAGQVVEIIAIGIGGVDIIDYQDFVADGETALFLTAADYEATGSIFVTLEGDYVDVPYLNSTDFTDTEGKTLVRFPSVPPAGADVKIITFSSDDEGLSNLIRINKETHVYDGATLSYPLGNFINDPDSDASSSVIVEHNGKALRGVDSSYAEYDGTNNVFEMTNGTLGSQIVVYVDSKLMENVTEYSYNGLTRELTIKVENLEIGSTMQVVNTKDAEYRVEDQNVVVENLPELLTGDQIEITWFSRYEAMGVIADEVAGGLQEYKLLKQPLGIGYVWVYLNGQRLTVDFEYAVSIPTSTLKLSVPTDSSDEIKIIVFGTDVYKPTSAYEIHKDMWNNYTYNTYSINEVELTHDLFYADSRIRVTDASSLPEPARSKNIPGTVYIDGERIDYMIKDGNELRQLRRGVAGTSTKIEYAAGTPVVDSSRNVVLPYNDQEERTSFSSNSFVNKFIGNSTTTEFLLTFTHFEEESLNVYIDGDATTDYTIDGATLTFNTAPVEGAVINVRSLLVGPLAYVPSETIRPWVREEDSTIPEEYGPCDTVEMFVAGSRLRKDPIWQYSEELGATSPIADKYVDAEFAVNGADAYIRATHDLPDNVTVDVVRRVGQTWYDQPGKTLLDNTTLVAEAIEQTTTFIPE